MTRSLVCIAACLMRGWTRAYTAGLPESLATERRREIESDLWESQRDLGGDRVVNGAGEILGRLLVGVPDDVLWRVEHVADDVPARRVAAAVAVGALVLAAIWTGRRSPSMVDARPAGRVADCVTTAEPPRSTPELRLRIMDCAGAFFTPHRTFDRTPPRP